MSSQLVKSGWEEGFEVNLSQSDWQLRLEPMVTPQSGKGKLKPASRTASATTVRVNLRTCCGWESIRARGSGGKSRKGCCKVLPID